MPVNASWKLATVRLTAPIGSSLVPSATLRSVRVKVKVRVRP